jgi:hypothetical protein
LFVLVVVFRVWWYRFPELCKKLRITAAASGAVFGDSMSFSSKLWLLEFPGFVVSLEQGVSGGSTHIFFIFLKT